jgi:flagellar assembly protein FliH
MGLIKSADAPISVAAFSMQDIESAARNVILRAQKKAEQIVADAQTTAIKIRDHANGEGFEDGLKRGLAMGTEEGKKNGHAQALAENSAAMTKLISSLTQVVRQIDEERDLLENRALAEVVQLSCSIARKVTKRQGAIDPQVMCQNLKEALGLAVHAADVRLAVHPTQIKTLQDELPNLRLAWPQLKHIDLAEDSSIAPGGARVMTTHGQVDGDLDVQLDRIVAELMPDEKTAEGR